MAPTRSGKRKGKRRGHSTGSYIRGSANVQLASEKKEEPVLDRNALVLSEAWKQLIDEVFFRENTYVTLKGELDLVDKEGAKLEMIKFLENVFGRDDAAEMDVKVLDVGKKKFLCRLSDDEMDKLSQEYDEQVEVEDPRGDFC